MSGKKDDLDAFIEDLKRDKAVINIERKQDTFILIERADSKAVGFHTPKILFIKPVVLWPDGSESWEVGAWEKTDLTNFVNSIKSEINDFTLKKLVRTTVDNIFFPRLLPDLTDNQKRALELAIQEGYYETPRRTDLRKLAKLDGVSLATFQEHLHKAEGKLIPNMLTYIS